jgi:hypothetical protein
MDQLTDDLWSNRLWSERIPKRLTQNTSIKEASSFCHARVGFHPFQQLSHMTLGLMAKTFMSNLKCLWSRCNVNFQCLYCDHNTQVCEVCIHHLPSCCHKQTVSLKYNPLTFHDDTNSMLWRTLYREQVSSNFGCQVAIAIKLKFVCRGLGLLKNNLPFGSGV